MDTQSARPYFVSLRDAQLKAKAQYEKTRDESAMYIAGWCVEVLDVVLKYCVEGVVIEDHTAIEKAMADGYNFTCTECRRRTVALLLNYLTIPA